MLVKPIVELTRICLIDVRKFEFDIAGKHNNFYKFNKSRNTDDKVWFYAFKYRQSELNERKTTEKYIHE